MSIWNWAEFLGPVSSEHQLTIGEGATPLVRSRSIGPALGLSNLYFKLESCNPTGSFKDRFAAAAISDMLQQGCTDCIATSSGNTGAALAACCAAAQIRCRIAIVETAPDDKLKQMMAYGAEIFRVQGFGLDPQITSETFAALQRHGARPNHGLQISAYKYSAAGMVGVETIAFELASSLNSVQHVFCPAGGGGLCVAVARGFEKLVEQGSLSVSPAVHCVQPMGNDTIAGPLRSGDDLARPVDCKTKISGLQVASVIDGDQVIQACRTSGGTGHCISDQSIWETQRALASGEGIFAEPAGATALAGLRQAVAHEELDPHAPIVCLVTGSGFKDGKSVDQMNTDRNCPMITVDQLLAE